MFSRPILPQGTTSAAKIYLLNLIALNEVCLPNHNAMIFNVPYLESKHDVFSFLFLPFCKKVDLYLITLGLHVS